jgi:hypothetical protein
MRKMRTMAGTRTLHSARIQPPFAPSCGKAAANATDSSRAIKNHWRRQAARRRLRKAVVVARPGHVRPQQVVGGGGVVAGVIVVVVVAAVATAAVGGAGAAAATVAAACVAAMLSSSSGARGSTRGVGRWRVWDWGRRGGGVETARRGGEER